MDRGALGGTQDPRGGWTVWLWLYLLTRGTGEFQERETCMEHYELSSERAGKLELSQAGTSHCKLARADRCVSVAQATPSDRWQLRERAPASLFLALVGWLILQNTLRDVSPTVRPTAPPESQF